MTVIDSRGRAHKPGGSPASTGGQFATGTRPAPAMRLNREDQVGLPLLNKQAGAVVHANFGAVVDADEVVATMNEIAVQKLAAGDWKQLSGNWGYLRNAAHRQAIKQMNARGADGAERGRRPGSRRCSRETTTRHAPPPRA